MGSSLRSRMRLIGSSLVVAALAAATLSMPTPVVAATATAGAPNSQEMCLVERVNAARRAAGVAPVVMATEIVAGVRAHSKYMSDNGFGHMSSAKRNGLLPEGSSMTAENVAYWSESSSTCDYMHNMLMGSPGHRANILHPSVRFLAPGVHVDSTGTWVTEVFFDATGYRPGGIGTFWDDDTSIFQHQIEKLVDAGITKGCGGGRFCPHDPVTRGQMAAFLVRALDLPAAGSAGFTDTAGSVFVGDIDRLAKAGITSGCTKRRFCPDDPVTRGQMAAFLVRALDLPAAGAAGFTDTAGSVFVGDINRLAKAGITSGCGKHRFCPGDPVTRGQMAAFIARALDL